MQIHDWIGTSRPLEPESVVPHPDPPARYKPEGPVSSFPPVQYGGIIFKSVPNGTIYLPGDKHLDIIPGCPYYS